MSVYRVASAYAKSLLELAQSNNVLEPTYRDMEWVAKTIQSSKELKNLLESPVIAHLKKLSIIQQLFKGKIQDFTLQFFTLIIKKKREDLLFTISKEFVAQYKTFKGIQPAVVVTSTPADDVLKFQFNRLIKSLTDKETDIEYKVNPSIVGGFIVTVGDKQIDQSVKSHLNKLKTQFTNNPYIPKY